jgi:hypothetical protein
MNPQPNPEIVEAVEQIVSTIDIIALNPRMWYSLAKVYRTALDALVAEGFAREEAITILSRQGAVKG